MSRGFAVIDVETTGLFPAKHDRIVEIAVVHVTPLGEIEAQWETLVNPMRDLGPQRIHGISASAASKAPTFEELAPAIAALIDGRVPVAHNATFDAAFVGHQLGQAGFIPVPSHNWLCTMRTVASIDRGAGRSLGACCSWAGVPFREMHAAASDAIATAHLLRALMTVHHDSAWWESWLNSAGRSSSTFPETVRWVPRAEASQPAPTLIQRLRVSVHEDPDIVNADYLALLDRVLLDRLMSETETAALAEFANAVGVGPASLMRMHRAYFAGVVASAWADGVVTPDEAEDIRAVGALLEIPVDEVEQTLLRSMSQVGSEGENLVSGFSLEAGDVVAITGETQRPRSEWFAILERHGFVGKDSVTKGVRLLMAADPDSMSGKAKKARDYGIPIVDEEGLQRLLGL